MYFRYLRHNSLLSVHTPDFLHLILLTDVCMHMNTENVAVDWVSNNLYWTDTFRTLLGVLDLDTMHSAELIWSGSNTAPYAIALDPNARWSEDL